jgi:hypothetical protein
MAALLSRYDQEAFAKLARSGGCAAKRQVNKYQIKNNVRGRKGC